MSQNVNLDVSGLYTSSNDYKGLPPGALDVADNVESRYKNVLEPRRGFEGIANSEISLTNFIRGTNFFIGGTDRLIALTAAKNLNYYDGVAPWTPVPGNYSTNISPPNATNAKTRFIKAGQNLYMTTNGGVKSLSSGTTASMVRAGVAKGLNLQAATNGASSGFFNNNVVLLTVGDVSNASPTISNLVDTTGVEVGQYVSGTAIPAGTKVLTITEPATILVETASMTAGSATITALASTTGLVAGVLVSGAGIPEGAKITTTGAGTATLNAAAFQTATGVTITFSSAPTITMTQNATGTHVAEAIQFYTGGQVGYRMVFGRVETDINGNAITRLGAPSSIALAANILSTSTNVSVTGTMPKNAGGELTFVQLYRSVQTSSVSPFSITPLDQYNLVFERDLVAGDFTARTITIVDDVEDSLVGIPLYSGADQEGIGQSNNPPPMCWDMCKFRDFTLFGNVTQPSTLKITITAVGPASGVQIGDTVNIFGTFLGIAFNETYTGAVAENQASRQFQIVTSGTPAQNITDTTASLIRVINYDELLPVHAILLSTPDGLPGQILLEDDNPSLDTFTVNAASHPAAFDPTLTNVVSDVNNINNGILVSKTGELEAVPALNLFTSGDTSSSVIRLIPLRDYVIVLKSDGVYKIQGTSPETLVINPFDLTTKIIGADTAVSLNSGVWMLSNQGVVSISDGGVEAKSTPIDDQLNTLIGTFLDNLNDISFALGYESDRKYILFVPISNNPYTEVQYHFNYVTSCWATWSRLVYTSFIHSNEDKIYIARADGTNKSFSKERKNGTYTDFVDEGVAVTISLISSSIISLDSVNEVEAGDILFQNALLFSPILSVDLVNITVTVQYALSFTLGAASVLKAYPCTITTKQVFGDNPAFMRQFSEGILLFKNTRFNVATISFISDFSQGTESVTLAGTGTGLWGLFGWGILPWGGTVIPSKIRFYIPQNKQIGSYLQPTVTIKQGYSDFKMQGMSISYYNISQEDGK